MLIDVVWVLAGKKNDSIAYAGIISSPGGAQTFALPLYMSLAFVKVASCDTAYPAAFWKFAFGFTFSISLNLLKGVTIPFMKARVQLALG